MRLAICGHAEVGQKIPERKDNLMTKEATKALRVATFTVEKQKSGRIFRPVNKRSHKWAKKVGKRTRLTEDDIKAIIATKKVIVQAYDDKGVRHTITVKKNKK